MLKYDDSLLGTEIPKDELDLSDKTETRYEVVDEIVYVGEHPDGIFFQVKCYGLTDKRGYTWHPVQDLCTDIPEKVIGFHAS